ncbi:MAG: ABC-2 family transporter protein [Microgenomates group bacterium]
MKAYFKSLPAILRSYGRVWLKLTIQQFQSQIANSRGAAILFIFGKLFRLGTAFLMLYVIMGKAKLIVGYTLPQAILILALFNFVSTLAQLFMRGIYMFRQKVVDGTFDFYLLNPLSELFYSLFSYTDPIDTLLVIPYLSLVGWATVNAGYTLSLSTILLLLVILSIAFILVLSWHIIILAIGVKYLEVDNTIMLYRDLEKMAAMPIEIYGKVGAGVMTYLFPFALMATIPARLVFGLYNPIYLMGFALLAFIQIKLAMTVWHHALLSYSSASS